jgi:glycosyltransferase involved in cell wall biosynthesis
MSSTSPKVSVLMPVYNNAAYLKEAIASILNQTFQDFELLIIDDGSTDNSLTILQEFAEQDPRISVRSQANQGVSPTRNELLRQAKGDYIAVMDGDDIALPERLAQQVAFLDSHPEILCVGGAYAMIDPEGQVLTHIYPPLQDADIQTQMLSGSTAIQHPCAMARRQAVLQAGGYDEALKASIDLDLWLRLGELGSLANLPDVVLHYRLHPNSISERSTARQSQYAKEACERAWQRRGIQGTYQAPNSWRHQFIVQCGWRGFNQRQRTQALTYGFRAVRMLPMNSDGWRLFLCALLKPMPKS